MSARRCSKTRFQDRCRATCNACLLPENQPVLPISQVCGCTVYRDGAVPLSHTACVRQETINGREVCTLS